MEMARVPIYWVGEARITPDPLAAVRAAAAGLSFARWLVDHADEVRGELMR
jgi:hypothetical protein